MTEKEKLLAGLLYDANFDPELQAERIACRDLCHTLNHLRPSQVAEQQTVVRQLIGKIHGDFELQPPFRCDYGRYIELGAGFFANYNLVILDAAKVTFGKNVFIGPDCGFYTSGHPIDYPRRNRGLEYAYPITVGDNVWFGGGVRVMPGVTIGSNVVIGSGSVVTRDIPGGVVAAGNPCKVLRPITPADETAEW